MRGAVAIIKPPLKLVIHARSHDLTNAAEFQEFALRHLGEVVVLCNRFDLNARVCIDRERLCERSRRMSQDMILQMVKSEIPTHHDSGTVGTGGKTLNSFA